MNTFLAYFARRSFLARIITIMVLLVGAGAISILKLQELPDVAFAEVEITTQYPGASSQDIELNITNKIEKELKSIQGLTTYYSQSFDGQSYINIELDESYEVNKTVRDIQQAVDRVQGLPKDISNPPLVVQKDTSSFDVMTFGVVTTLDNHALQQYTRELEKRLRSVPGVGNVRLDGYTEREFWIEVDPTKVLRYQLTFNDVIAAINTRSLSLSGGIVESWDNDQRIVTLTQIHTVEELANTIIDVLPTGEMIRLGDVAQVSDGFEKATELGMVDGQNAVVFSISKNASADIIATIDRVKTILDQENTRLEGQFSFPITLNLADDMAEKFSIVTINGGVGLILVLIVLSMILKRQVAFWVSVSIPFCVLGVMAVLPALGMNLDSITLAALLLVIGIIVDDSVIVAESIYQQKEQGKSGVEAATLGVQNVIRPIIASLTTTALVFIPMFFIPGTMGKAIIVIPITVITALLFSLAECTFTLPAHLATSLDSPPRNGSNNTRFTALIQRYKAILCYCLARKKRILVLALTCLVGSSTLLTTLKLDIFPSDAAKYIEIYTEIAPGTPLNKVRQTHTDLENAIAALPSNEVVSHQITYSSPVSRGLITLTNVDQRTRTANDIADSLSHELTNSTSINFVKFTVDAGGPPPGEPVEIRIISNNQKEREQALDLVMDWMSQHSGLDNVTHNEALTDPQLQVLPQYEWLARYNLTVQDLANTLRIAFDGDTVTSTWIGDEEVKLRVILDEKYRNLDKLATTKITTPSGVKVPLNRLAKVQEIQAPREILHYNGDRQILVSAQIIDDNLSSGALSQQLTQALTPQVGTSVRLDVGGEAENTDETMSGFFVAFPAAMIGIYFVLAIMFGSLLQPLLIMAVIPFAIVSALMALFLHMQPISLFALVGILGMAGVVVNNALVLVNRINELQQEGFSVTHAIVEAAASRFRPIVLTSITTVVGLLPLAYGIGGTDVYMGPMSLTLGYGLLLSLPIVLIVIPCLYALCARPKVISDTSPVTNSQQPTSNNQLPITNYQ
ncbi:efflux RND transporter permease subunit [Vibrio sp. ZSDZ65]|uniref:Efflux RND transporter permease subunit n=1 Tax=Vibrio qingdaonensis TaxID=2829491 RepID=A0A9X3CMM6_9VIBR|nr:efflux RND transporter permease subunit [Vibrio qingdaonensis]MCW8345939.1 efflux RND transporter permease subunit [Vibrio qingdaonensis]